MRPTREQILELIDAAFPASDARCLMTLKQGEALDNYQKPVPESLPTDWRLVTDDDLQRDLYGVHYLDAETKRFYLPAFLRYAVRHDERTDMTVHHALRSFVGSCETTANQREAIVAALEFLTLDETGAIRNEDALGALGALEARHPAKP